MGSVIVTMLICIALFTVIYEMIRRATASLKNRKEWEKEEQEKEAEREEVHMEDLRKEIFERMVYDHFAHYLKSALVIDQSKILAKKIWDDLSGEREPDTKKNKIVVKWRLVASVSKDQKCQGVFIRRRSGRDDINYYWNFASANIIPPEGIEAMLGLLRALIKLSCEHLKNNLDKSGMYAEFDLIVTEKRDCYTIVPEMNIDFSTPNPAYTYVAPRAL